MIEIVKQNKKRTDQTLKRIFSVELCIVFSFLRLVVFDLRKDRIKNLMTNCHF